MRTCYECRQRYEARREDQRYCGQTCNAAAKNREMTRARVLYRALYWWRLDRKTSAAALRFICREIRAWITEDQQAQRLPPPRHRHDMDRGAQVKKLPALKDAA